MRTLRALAWLSLGIALLAGGAFGISLWLELHLASGATPASPGVQQVAIRALAVTLTREALIPHASLALTLWLGVVRAAPRADASWRSLAASLLAAALLAFPAVGAFTFEAWSPRTAADVVSTALLLSCAVTFALWLARRALPGAPPGAFAAHALAPIARTEGAES